MVYHYVRELKNALQAISSKEKAVASRRYFPNGIEVIGATAGDIKLIIKSFQIQHKSLTAEQTLAISEELLAEAKYSEEKLLAFGLLNKFVGKNFDEQFLVRCEYWLENYADNWSLVDDLCIKTLYLFLMKRPHLIEKTQHWAHSKVSWCRRASNVVWVKFIERKIGKSIYRLDTTLIFQNCDLLLNDSDEFVQKSVGWLLKVTSVHHQQAVIDYLEMHSNEIPRSILRYAIEKMDNTTRQRLLKFKS